MMVNTDDLVTAKQIALNIDVTPSAVANWQTRHDDFPHPVFTADRCALWLWWQVESWAIHHGKGVFA